MVLENKNLEINVPIDATEVILTIKPMHADNIYSECKKFELRKAMPRRVPRKIYLYETEEKKAVTGHIIVDKVFSGAPRQIWREIEGKGIEQDRYSMYYEGQDLACVYSIKHAVKYKKPLNIEGLKKDFNFVVPQHFMYIDGLLSLDKKLNDISLDSVISSETYEGIKFKALNKSNQQDFIKLVHSSISENYADTGEGYPKKLINEFLGEKEINSLTSRRRFIFEIYENDILCGYIVLTQKTTGAFKTAPFCLHNEFVNKGIALKVRKLIHTVVEKHGGRKVYCTVPTSNKPAVNYLLSAKYQTEAHLVRHYHNDHDDIVYGFDLSLAGNIFHPKPRRAAMPTRAHFQSKITQQIANNLKVCISNFLVSHYADLYFDRLIKKIESKDAAILAYGEPTNIAVIIEPKTNCTVRIHVYAQSFHTDILKKLITLAELEAAVRFKAKKIFITVDIMDFELLPVALELGYRPEGVLKNYYYVGNDLMIVSKIG